MKTLDTVATNRSTLQATAEETKARLEAERSAMASAISDEQAADTVDEIAAAQARQNAIRVKIGRTEKALADVQARLDALTAQERGQATRERLAELANLQLATTRDLVAIRSRFVAAAEKAVEEYNTTRQAGYEAQVEFLELARQLMPAGTHNDLEWLRRELEPLGADLSCLGIEFVTYGHHDQRPRNWLQRWFKLVKIPHEDLGPAGGSFDALVKD